LGIANSKKSKKNGKPLRGEILRDQVARKNLEEYVHKAVLVATIQKIVTLVFQI
jgi:hypothetical protein